MAAQEEVDYPGDEGSFSETPVTIYKSPWRHIPEQTTLQHRYENLKSSMFHFDTA
jgi:hypothetical protein